MPLLAMVLLALVLALAPPTPCSAESKGVGGLSFRNMANRTLIMYWVSHTGEYKHQAQVEGNGGQTGFQTYPGHRFIWSELSSNPPVAITANGAEGSEFRISEEKMVYTFVDDSTSPEVRSKLEEELDFRDNYYKEHGYHWVGTTWPRPPPTLWMIRPKYIGEEMQINLSEDPLSEQHHCTETEVAACLGPDGRKPNFEKVWQSGPESVTIEMMSTRPRVFRVKEFLSDFEADYIVQQTRPKLSRSTTGHGINAKVDTSRTSKSAWLSRSHSKIMDAIYRRIGLITNIPEQLLTESENAENLNVLNYPKGAEYTPHYDWGPNGEVASRFLSGLLYLNTPAKGGGTSFPKAIMPDKSEGIYVPAEKRSIVFFYDLLEDGNGDVLSLHAGTPVEEGEKWVSPLWIWEPSRSNRPHPLGDLSQRAAEESARNDPQRQDL